MTTFENIKNGDELYMLYTVTHDIKEQMTSGKPFIETASITAKVVKEETLTSPAGNSVKFITAAVPNPLYGDKAYPGNSEVMDIVIAVVGEKIKGFYTQCDEYTCFSDREEFDKYICSVKKTLTYNNSVL